MKKILAVASWGGHLQQLRCILEPLLPQHEIILSTTSPLAPGESFVKVFHQENFSRRNWWRFFPAIIRFYRLIQREHITHIVTTGAAPGLAAVIASRFLHRRSLWIDSCANAADLSSCGRMARHFADTTITMWPDVAALYNNVTFAPNPLACALERNKTS